MGKRLDGYYPTDPYATDALRAFLARRYPSSLRESWIDPCAGYGGLLEALLIPPHLREAIEQEPRHRQELLRRVPTGRIGDGLTLPWPAVNVGMNPPFDNDLMVAFVRRALVHQERTGGLICCLALATFWHSDAMRTRGAGLRRPSLVLVPDQRVSCDGTGRGDMRAIDWLVWVPGVTSTTVHWLPPAAPDAQLIAAHRRLAGVVS